MADKKNWMDQHFGPSAAPLGKPSAPAQSSSGTGKAIAALVALVVIIGGALAVADFYGVITFGIFSREKPAIEQTANPAAAPMPEAFRPSPPPPPPPQPLPERPEEAPVIVDAPAATPDPQRIKQLKARAAQLDRGLDLMTREQAEAQSLAGRCQWELTIRRAAFAPFSAAERINNIEEYARQHPNLPVPDQLSLKNQHNYAVADRNNASKRLAEVNDKIASLQGRIAKASTERAAITQEIGAP
jgi:hypothetical protein